MALDHFHLPLRILTGIIIFYLLNLLENKFKIEFKYIKYWYILGMCQTSFLLFPFFRDSSIPLIWILPIKGMFLSFTFFLWISTKTFLEDDYKFSIQNYFILGFLWILGITVNRVNDEIVYPNASPFPIEYVPIFIIGTFVSQIFFVVLAFINIFKIKSNNQNEIHFFIKKYFLISAVVSVLLILLTIATHQTANSEIRKWFVTLFNFATIVIAYFMVQLDVNQSPQTQTYLEEVLEDKNQFEFSSEFREKYNQFIIKNKELFFTECTLKDIAAQLTIPEYKFRKYIQDELGFNNFNQYINHIRIDEACRMLRSTDHIELPISRIALQVGFNSIATFNRVFKELKGLNPKQFRTQYRSLNDHLISD